MVTASATMENHACVKKNNYASELKAFPEEDLGRLQLSQQICQSNYVYIIILVIAEIHH